MIISTHIKIALIWMGFQFNSISFSSFSRKQLHHYLWNSVLYDMIFFFSFCKEEPKRQFSQWPAVPCLLHSDTQRKEFENVLELEPRTGVILKKLLMLKILF